MRNRIEKRLRTLAAVLFVTLAMLAFAIPALAAEGTFPIKVQVSENYTVAFQTLKLVNAERSKKGLDPLVMDVSLLKTAMQRAAECSLYCSHQRPDLSSFDTAFPTCWTAAGENIAAGQTTAADVMNSWMNSSGHRANILSSDFDTIGIGCVKNGNSYYWTQCFIKTTQKQVTAKPASYSNRKAVHTVNAAKDDRIVTARFGLAKKTLSINETTSPYVNWTGVFGAFRMAGTNPVMTSSDKAVCTIENGNVRAVGSGTAKITVYYKGYAAHKDVITVRVTNDRLLLPTSGLKGVLTKYNKIKLNWKPVTGAKGYAVYMAAPGGSYKLIKKTTYRTFSIGSLKAGKKYRFVVKGYDAKGRYSTGNKAIAVTTLAAPAKINVIVRKGEKVDVYWREVAGASGYQVSRSADPKKTKIAASLKKGVLTTRLVSPKGIAYVYKVRAYRTYGTTRVYGPWSYVMTRTTN